MKITNPTTYQNHRKMSASALWQAGSIWMAALACILAMAAQTASAAVQVRSQQMIITVPDGGTSVQALTNFVAVSGTPGTETLSALGSLPAGDTLAFSALFANSGTTNFGTMLTNTAVNVPDGQYPIDLNVSGSVVNDLIITLQSGRMWTGVTNSTGTWGSTANWVGGNLPNSSSDVLFTSLGAGQTLYTNGGGWFSNSVVDQNFTIASLRFDQTTSGAMFQILSFNPGVTLNITGANGLSMLQDLVDDNIAMNTTLLGSGGTLNVNNPAANVTMTVETGTGNIIDTLDMSRLGTFTANVNRVGIGDYTLYPNFTNIAAESYSSSAGPFYLPAKYIDRMLLAQTNVIKTSYVDVNNYTNALTRIYPIMVANNYNAANGSSSTPALLLGLTNSFNSDGICIGGFGGTTAAFNFNPFLYITTNLVPNVSTNFVTNSMYAKFRNSDGVSRMSAFSVGDMANPLPAANGNSKANVDFSSFGGHVDMLVDRLYLGRDRTNVFSVGDTAQTTLSFGPGTINANTVILGDQENGDFTNINYAFGTLTVSNNGVLVVNNSLTLGYDTADQNDKSSPGSTWGVLNVTGGMAMINTVSVGGPMKTSGEVGALNGSIVAKPNIIAVTNGTLIVSNMMADASAISTNSQGTSITAGMLGQFNMVNSTLELFINGTNQGPYVFASTFNFGGSTSNTLIIGSIQNIAVPSSGSTNVPLFWVPFASPNATAISPAFTKIVVPSGFQAALLLDPTNSQVLDLNISQHTPRNLLWKGYTDNNWDTTTKDWLDLNTGLHTNFDNGDFTTFDDTAGTVTNINITGSVQLIPNNILVTNNTAYYKFTGSSLAGGSTLTKNGTGTLEFDSTMSLGVTLNAGQLVGSGTIGGVAVAAGAVLDYSGNVNGNVGCSGTVINNGTITGPLTVNSGGVVTNFVNLNGTFNVKSGSFVLNAIGANITWPLGSSSTVATNATFENGGTINGDTINCSGTWLDLAAGNQMTIYQFSMGAGGTFYPGDNALGTTLFASATTSLSFPGALLQAQGATTVLNVNMANNPSNTLIEVPFMNFGASSSSQTQTGSTLQINNTGSIPFAAGQTFTFFEYPNPPGGIPGNTGSSTNTFPVISPAYPGPGLAWDLSQLWSAGSIGVVRAASVHPVLTNSLTLLGTSNIVIQLSWNTNTFGNNSSNFFGWRVETQTDPISTGLNLNNANWAGVSGSWTNGSVNITNSVNTTNAIFYRLVFP